MMREKTGVATESEDETTEVLADWWFNPYRAPRSDNARALINDVLHQVQEYERFRERRKRARRRIDQGNFEAAVAAIIADLVHLHLINPSGQLVVTRSKTVLGHKSRYRPAIYNAVLPTILDELSAPEMAFITQKVRGGPTF
jgi:hypothetical protein